MVDFTQALKNAARSAACSVADISQSLFPKPPGLDALGFAKRAFAFRDNFKRQFCNDEPTPPSPPFPGGQCPTKYLVRIVYNATNPVTGNPVTGFYENTWWGPIGGLVVTKPSETYYPDGSDVAIRCRGRGSDPTPLPAEVTFDVASQPWNDTVWSIQSITRVDGQADNCGNPPPVVPPYNAPDFSIDGDITYTNNDGIDITVPVGILIAPVKVDANFNLTVPVKFTFSPNFYFDPTFNFNIDVDLNLGGGDDKISPPYVPPDEPYRPTPGPSTDPDDYYPPTSPPSPPPDVPDPPAPDPEDDPAPVIRAVLVTVTEALPTAKATIIGQGANPDIYAPSLGYVSFQIRLGNGSGGWTSDIPVKNKRNLIPCPWGGGALSVAGTPMPGITWTLTPIYGLADEALR